MGLHVENVFNDHGLRDDDYDEEVVDLCSNFFNNLFDIQEAQVFEYNYAHMMDKPFESIFGFI